MWNSRNTTVTGFDRPIWMQYGFTDAFNPEKHPWFDLDYIGIDQGPEVLMIENHLNDAVWYRTMRHPDLVNGLALAGFVASPAAVEPPLPSRGLEDFLAAAPNPFRGSTTLSFAVRHAGRVRLSLYDLAGRLAATLVDARLEAGVHAAPLDSRGLSPGVYLSRLEADGARSVRRLVLLR
jgi:hypothetical protein